MMFLNTIPAKNSVDRMTAKANVRPELLKLSMFANIPDPNL